MADSNPGQSGQPVQPANPSAKPSRRLLIVWVVIIGGLVLLLVLKDKVDARSNWIGQHQFEELVDSGQIAHATVFYDQQNSALNEISGTYYQTADVGRIEVPFRAKVRMTRSLEEKMYRMPQFEPREPNTALMNVLWSLLPIVIIAVLIWFFFVRQIKLAAKGRPGIEEINRKVIEQQVRYDKILEKWEAQANRMDEVLKRSDKDAQGMSKSE